MLTRSVRRFMGTANRRPPTNCAAASRPSPTTPRRGHALGPLPGESPCPGQHTRQHGWVLLGAASNVDPVDPTRRPGLARCHSGPRSNPGHAVGHSLPVVSTHHRVNGNKAVRQEKATLCSVAKGHTDLLVRDARKPHRAMHCSGSIRSRTVSSCATAKSCQGAVQQTGVASPPLHPKAVPGMQAPYSHHSFKMADQALLVAQVGHQQIATTLITRARRPARNDLGWLRNSYSDRLST